MTDIKRTGFHIPKKERTGFEHELDEAMEGYFRSQSYYDVMKRKYAIEKLDEDDQRLLDYCQCVFIEKGDRI